MQRISFYLLAILLLPSTVFAAGFEFQEGGARALARGGAFVALGDDPTLIKHNPAGLAALDGFRFNLNWSTIWWLTEYQRMVQTDGGAWTTNDPMSGLRMAPVENIANPWMAPFIAISGQVMDGLTLGLGIYGPSAIGERAYKDPRDIAPHLWSGQYEFEEEFSKEVQEDIPRHAPHRYGMIMLRNRVAYPTFSIGWQPLEWLRVGASGQLIIANLDYSVALRHDLLAMVLGDGPQADLIADLSVASPNPGYTGILGVQIMPMEGLTIGMTVRPRFTMNQEGTFSLAFNDLQANPDGILGLRQTRNEAFFTSAMPTIIRMGIGWEKAGWMAELAGSYEMLSFVDYYRLEPNVTIEHNIGPMPDIELEGQEILIAKDWRDTFGIRLGGGAALDRTFGLPVPLEVFLGCSIERGAIPTRTQNLDFISQDRAQVMAGLAYDLGFAKLSMGFSQSFEPVLEIRDSEVFLIDASMLAGDSNGEDGDLEANLTMVGNGDLKSSHTLLIMSIEGRFGLGR